MAIPAQSACSGDGDGRRFGVYGFCFYYYWFNGRRLLEQPLNQFLVRGKPDFPFCICWANENWTSRSDDPEKDEVLIKQEYGEDFSVKFIRAVIPILKDSRYITIQSEPVLLIYQASLLPDLRATAEIWRMECRKAGISSVHLVLVESFGIGDPRSFGFDAAVEFPSRTGRFIINPRTFPGVDPTFEGSFEDYRKVVPDQLAKPLTDYILYRGVLPPWDDTPRRKKQAPLIFVNAWNDWPQGAILEPGIHNGYGFLEATRADLSQGLADHLGARGLRIEESAASNVLMPNTKDVVPSEALENQDRRPSKTEAWFSDEQLATIVATSERRR